MISEQEYLMGRDTEFPLTAELKANMAKLLAALNKFRAIYGKPMYVTSGYRPDYYNTQAHGAPNSNHIVCLACDFQDLDKSLGKWCVANLDTLEACGLYIEDPKTTRIHTVGWVHMQCVPPASGHRVFIP